MATLLPFSPRLVGAVAAGALALSGCAASTGSTASPGADDGLQAAAAFYPLEFVAARVIGDHGTVIALTDPGVEPHDLELSPAIVRGFHDLDVVLYLGEFQPAVDDAVATTGVHAVDAADVVDLHEHDEEEGHEDDEHAEEDHGHEHGDGDPHFWLDLALLSDYAQAVAAEASTLDPAHAEDYRANGDELSAELTALDQEFASRLEQCERDTVVVSHEAFGYLAERYGLHQEGIAGVDPDAEPSPARLRELRELIDQTGATTIFTETLVNPAVAEALAADAGVQTAVLDPVEGVAEGDDYIGVMSRNLTALEEALGCR